jgi:hypothetical protein
MKTTRREIMMFAGGSAVGVLFTPAPWRLITDTALWSENWPGIPVPARGEIRARYTNCSLCPAGCAVRARCVGDQPVALAGVAGHPLSHGALCPFGLAGYHLPYLPSRVKQGPIKEATAAVADGIAKCGPAEYIVTLDLLPARTASWTYRRAMAAIKNGRYVTPSSDASVAVDLTKTGTPSSDRSAAVDLAKAPTPSSDAWMAVDLTRARTPSSGALMAMDLTRARTPSSDALMAVNLANVRTPSSDGSAAVDLAKAPTPSSDALMAVDLARARTPSSDTSVAVDLTKARTVLSLGVPLLDGWGTPGNVIAARPGFRLIQAEAVESRTASMADWWLRIRPGSEEALAQGLAGTLTLAAAAEATGLAESEIAALAAELKDNGPVLVLGSSRLESTGRTIVTRRETPVPAEWRKAAPVTGLASLPDGSIRVLIIDESTPGAYLPWKAIEKKLVADNPVVVALAWSREGYGRHAQYVIPVGVYPEVAGDIPPAIDSVAATFRISTPLVAAPAGCVKPEEFVAAAAGLPLTDTLRERADAIHKTGRGTLFTYADAKSAALKGIGAEDFWKALNAGGCWIDTPDDKAAVARLAPTVAQSRSSEESELPLAVVLSQELTPASPILSKLYQESNLRLGPNRVALHPSCGLEDGAEATLQTVLGKCAVHVTLDAGVPAGLVRVSASPAILDLCAAGARAKVVRA